MLMDHLREYDLRELERGKQYRVLGRTGESVDPLYLFWTGSALELNLRATELWVTFESSYRCDGERSADPALYGPEGKKQYLPLPRYGQKFDAECPHCERHPGDAY